MDKKLIVVIILVVLFVVVLCWGFIDEIIMFIAKMRRKFGFWIPAVLSSLICLPIIILLSTYGLYVVVLFLFVYLISLVFAYMIYKINASEKKKVNLNSFEYKKQSYKEVRDELKKNGFKYINCVRESGGKKGYNNKVAYITIDGKSIDSYKNKLFEPEVEIVIYYYYSRKNG